MRKYWGIALALFVVSSVLILLLMKAPSREALESSRRNSLASSSTTETSKSYPSVVKPKTNQPDAIRAEISIDQQSLQQPAYKQGGSFFVDTKVTNISSANKDIKVWVRTGWSWMSESQNVAPAVESTTNKFTMLTLKPGESHSAKLELYRNPYYNRSITFRLGFVPDFDRAVSAIYINKIAEIYWSNSVTLPK